MKPTTRRALLALVLIIELLALAWLLFGRTERGTKHPRAYLDDDLPALAATAVSPSRYRIIDTHEHVFGEKEARVLLAAMDRLGVERAVLAASSDYTFTLDPALGFTGHRENGERLIAIKHKWPSRFHAFVTFDPCDGSDHLSYVRDAVARGADGVKLYLGHGGTTPKFAFHCKPLDHASLMPFWSWAEASGTPLLVHVNLSKYGGEFDNLMQRHPRLRISVPHFGLHAFDAKKRARLSALFARYPNLYTDISFGHHSIQLDGFERIAESRAELREFIVRHRDRVMFGADLVVEPGKDAGFVEATLRSYRQMVEEPQFRFFIRPRRPMKGLALDRETQRQIYEVTPAKFLAPAR